jgi:gentisate 1,2-dioxygenase
MTSGPPGVTAGQDSITAADLDTFYRDLHDAHLQPLWKLGPDLLPSHPHPQAIPWVWRASETYPLAARAVRAVPVDRGGERRVLSLANPGLDGRPYAAGTLWAGLQCLGPAEVAPAHRHTPGAIRFVLTGTGVWTTVNGVRCDMSPGDLVLTPSWHWHDHTNSGAADMVWFDGLDLPLISFLDAVFYEPYPDYAQPVTGIPPADADTIAASYADGLAGPIGPDPSPLLTYRWADTDAALARLGLTHDQPMVTAEFINPKHGTSALPTLSCAMSRLLPGRSTLPLRRVGNAVFVVFRGAGHSVIEGLRIDWSAGDIFVVPSWAAAEHASGDGADLFVLADTPVLRALGLYREQALASPQQVHGTLP